MTTTPQEARTMAGHMDIEDAQVATMLREYADLLERPALPVSAWCLGNPAYADSSNILAAHDFTPDAEHMDEWVALYAAPPKE